MKKKHLLAILGLSTFLGSTSLTGYAQEQTVHQETVEEKKVEVNKEQRVIDFPLNQENANMQAADKWSNGYQFNNIWRKENITFKNGNMELWIDKEPEGSSKPFSGAEYRTISHYHYGKYEVKMKPIKSDGVVSSFFTYTGPSDNNPWDEIDIEFLGKDTTKVQFNYYTDGKGENEFIYDLGFDAAQELHTYAFEWLPQSITWFVDGKEVHKATKNIPQTAEKVMMNVWPGITVDEWLKPFTYSEPLKAEYASFKVTEYGSAELAEAARQAEAEKQAEAARQAEAEKQAEAARQAEAAKQAEAVRQAEAKKKNDNGTNKQLPQTGSETFRSQLVTISGIALLFLTGLISVIRKKQNK